MTKRRIYTLLATAIAFFLGIIFQSLFDNWLPTKNVTLLSLIFIVVAIYLIVVITSTILADINKGFGQLTTQLAEMNSELTIRTGLSIEYIEDSFDGKSYHRSTELIAKATKSLMFVSPWTPSIEYRPTVSSPSVKEAKQKYYDAITEQIKKHSGDDNPFHRRILQVPKEYESQPLTFNTDSTFFDYLCYAIKIQEIHPRSCLLRRTSSLLNIHFTIVDDRYVIIPFLAQIKDGYQVRHGEIIIDDGQGTLVRGLNYIYKSLDAHSHPLEMEHLKGPEVKNA